MKRRFSISGKLYRPFPLDGSANYRFTIQEKRILPAEPDARRALIIFCIGAFITGVALVSPPELRLPGLAIGGIAVLLSFFLYPVLGLVAALVLSGIPNLTTLIPNVVSGSKVVALVAALGCVSKPYFQARLQQLLQSRVFLSYLAPAVWYMLLFPISVADLTTRLSRMYNLVGVLVAVPLLVIAVRTKRELQFFAFLALVGGATVGLWAIFFAGSSAATDNFEVVDGITVFYEHNLGILLGLCLCLSVVLFEGRPLWFYTVIIGSSLAAFICMLLTHSRSSWAGLTVGSIATLLWLASRGQAKWFSRFVLIGAVGMFLVMTVAQMKIAEPMVEIVMARVDTFSDQTNVSTGRIDVVWPRALEFLKSHFAFGGGLAAGSVVGVAHNQFLEAGVEGGIVALFLLGVSLRFILVPQRHPDYILVIVGLAAAWNITAVAQTNPATYYSLQYAFVVGLLAWIEIDGRIPPKNAPLQMGRKNAKLRDHRQVLPVVR